MRTRTKASEPAKRLECVRIPALFISFFFRLSNSSERKANSTKKIESAGIQRTPNASRDSSAFFNNASTDCKPFLNRLPFAPGLALALSQRGTKGPLVLVLVLRPRSLFGLRPPEQDRGTKDENEDEEEILGTREAFGVRPYSGAFHFRFF